MGFNKDDYIAYRIDRAMQTAVEAQTAFEQGSLNLSENRIYYAMFYMTQALAVKKGFQTSKHSILKGWLNKEFVHTGLLPKDIFAVYSTAFDKRQEGDYEDFATFEHDEVAFDLGRMNYFLSALREYISKL